MAGLMRRPRQTGVMLAAMVCATVAPTCSEPHSAAGGPAAEDAVGAPADAPGSDTVAAADTAEGAPVQGNDASEPPEPRDTAGTLTGTAEPFYGGFAFSDDEGTRLLALSELAYPEAVMRGICQSGRIIAVRFSGMQEYSEDSAGRQTARNFDYEPGAVFQLEEGQARPDETCFLMGPSVLALGTPEVPRRASRPVCDPADSARITRARGRRVESCRRLFTVGGSVSVLSARFELQADSALASLILTDSSTLTFADFAAENRPEDGTWRAGDGGEFHPEDFDVLFVIDEPGAKAMALTWAGAEGESSILEVARDGSVGFDKVVGNYRYWVPY